MTKTKNKRGLLPGIELMIIGVFIVSFLVITIPQCEPAREQDEGAMQINPPTEDTVVRENFAMPPPVAPVEEVRTTPMKRLPLYITIDQINMRVDPNVASRVIRKLDLHEKVYYEGETTEKTKEIDWGGGVVTNEPWVKVRTLRDELGWVYGAGVHFYKKTFAYPDNEDQTETSDLE